MIWPLTIVSAGFGLLLLVLIFRPLEMAFPAKPGQKLFRPAWAMDLSFFLGQYLFWNGVVLAIAAYFSGWLHEAIPQGIRLVVTSQPWWLQAIEVILIGDFFVYWGHRLQHNNAILWRFHRVHHSSEHLDWLAAHREHPIDTIYTMMMTNVPVIILGFPMQTLAGVVAFRAVWAVYIHSNVRLPIGPLRWFIGAPELHHWHHDRDVHAGNYANLSPLMDILFRTYTCPGHEPEAFGVEEQTSNNYLGQIFVDPFKSDRGRALPTASEPSEQSHYRAADA